MHTSTQSALTLLLYISFVSSISCRWRTHATRCVTANVPQRNVDAQCDKLATHLG